QDAAHAPIGETRVLEGAGTRGCALVALPADQGWMCAWVGSEPAAWALRIDPKGDPIGVKQRLSPDSATPLSNIALCLLSGKRLAAVWDTNDNGMKIRGRLLGLDAAPLGDPFEFEPSPRHQDWDPALAPTGNGGFVASWTSGAVEDGMRDVVA